jgi:hypothetical protein
MTALFVERRQIDKVNEARGDCTRERLRRLFGVYANYYLLQSLYQHITPLHKPVIPLMNTNHFRSAMIQDKQLLENVFMKGLQQIIISENMCRLCIRCLLPCTFHIDFEVVPIESSGN